jgi:hypothetical protein
MNISLEYEQTPADVVGQMRARQPRWSRMYYFAVAGFVFVQLLFFSLIGGLRSTEHFYMVLGPLLGFALLAVLPALVFPALGWLMGTIWHPSIRVIFDDDNVTVQLGNIQQKVPWSSFTQYGSAVEHADHFWMECGRGVTVWLPKRVFATPEDLVAFRAALAEEMGNRLQSIPNGREVAA